MDNRYFDSQVDEPTVKLAGMLTPEEVFSSNLAVCVLTQSLKSTTHTFHRRQLI